MYILGIDSMNNNGYPSAVYQKKVFIYNGHYSDVPLFTDKIELILEIFRDNIFKIFFLQQYTMFRVAFLFIGKSNFGQNILHISK